MTVVLKFESKITARKEVVCDVGYMGNYEL
jgi:hypothetical protein